MHWAASCDDVEAIEALVRGGASQTLTGGVISNGTALWDAALFGQKEALQALLRLGSDPLQRCAPFPAEAPAVDGGSSGEYENGAATAAAELTATTGRTLLEFLGDDERIEAEVRQMIEAHIAKL